MKAMEVAKQQLLEELAAEAVAKDQDFHAKMKEKEYEEQSKEFMKVCACFVCVYIYMLIGRWK